ncbi:MAG: MraY family glycosyltransferase [Pseudomonadota bacterium]
MSMDYTFLVLSSLFAASLLVTRLVLSAAPAMGLVDVPGPRSAHRQPIPRGGGLSLVLIFTGFTVLLGFSGTLLPTDLYLFLLAVPVAFVGFLDDRRPLSHRWRIAMQLLMALAVYSLLRELPPLYLGGINVQLGLWAWLLVPLAMTWLCNLYNFMDGIDGLAAAECCFVAAASAWLTGSQSPLHATLGLALFVIAAGFLVWNWSPARIFMGDVGSTWLGFVFGVLILMSLRDQVLTIWVWFLLLSVFIVDTGWTLAVRLARGHAPYEAHNTHAYQILARRFGHARVVAGIMTVNVLYVMPLAWLAEKSPEYGVFLAISGIVPFMAICWRVGAGDRAARDRNRADQSASDQGSE